MTGRDPEQAHRAASPLELLFDLVFVVAIAQASSELSHGIAAGHFSAAVTAFTIALVVISWAWINFAWFSSAYDTDDAFYRFATLVQMVGLVIVTLGLPEFFASVDAGVRIETSIIVAGYVVMRVAVIGLWIRAAIEDRRRRRTALAYVGYISIAQVGWIAVSAAPVPTEVTLIGALCVFGFELTSPLVVETRIGGIPWHPHHIAERYGLLTIITLGETIFGTVTAATAIVSTDRWSRDAAILAFAGVGLAFGIWWLYFTIPAEAALRRRRRKAFLWGYAHLLLYAAIAAMGAGLHVVALAIENPESITTSGAVLAVALPVAVVYTCTASIDAYLLGRIDALRITFYAGAISVAALGCLASLNGMSLTACLLIVTLSPLIPLIGGETTGRRGREERSPRVRT